MADQDQKKGMNPDAQAFTKQAFKPRADAAPFVGVSPEASTLRADAPPFKPPGRRRRQKQQNSQHQQAHLLALQQQQQQIAFMYLHQQLQRMHVHSQVSARGGVQLDADGAAPDKVTLPDGTVLSKAGRSGGRQHAAKSELEEKNPQADLLQQAMAWQRKK